MEAAVREGLGGSCAAEMNHRGERLLLPLVGGRVWPACKNGLDPTKTPVLSKGTEKFADSLVEQAGFEPSVPLATVSL